MNTANKNPLDNYKRFLLNRTSCSTPFIEFLENCLVSDDEATNHCFHKVMVHGWKNRLIDLFEAFSDYFTSIFIPVHGTTQVGISYFYTSSISFINKIIRYDFMFPYQQNMFNIDVLFNDKTSSELFNNNLTVQDIVTSVVCRRFNDKCELDLSNFCNDQEFIEMRISFYKISFLSHFKILMLRMGRDAKALNLSNNNLSSPPIDILNFFIKGDMTSVNLSHNNIPSISDLFRVSSKIEKLWVEGNPLCDNIDCGLYVKSITMKFPRLSELDGMRINDTGIAMPFIRNYLVKPGGVPKMLVEKFLTLYFSHYDTPKRPGIHGFYDPNSILSVTTAFTSGEEQASSSYISHARNALKKQLASKISGRVFIGLTEITELLTKLPTTVHDPASFTVDVIVHETHMLVIVVSGTFTEGTPARLYHFRRTFTLGSVPGRDARPFVILNDMLHVGTATHEQRAASFKNPVRNHNSLALIDPEREESEALVKIFTHITHLNREDAEIRLRLHKWDMKAALQTLIDDIKRNNIRIECFTIPNSSARDEDYLSDMSSLMDDVD